MSIVHTINLFAQNIRNKAGEQQDFFISQLKQEIYELRQRQRDYSQLQEQMAFLEKKHRQAAEDKIVMINLLIIGDRDRDLQISQDLKTIDTLIRELDFLRDQNRDQEQEQETVLIRISETNSEIHQRNVEIQDQRSELNVLDGKIYSERKEIERLDHEHRDAVNVSHKNYQEIARLKDLITVRELDNRGFQSRLNAMEQEVEANNRRIQHQTEARDQKDAELNRAHQIISQEQLAIGQFKNQNAQLDKDIQYFEGLNYKHQQTQIGLSKANEQEGKDLMAAESERRAILKARDEEHSQLKNETDHVKNSNARYVEDSHELQTQIESLNRHVALLNQQNYELSVELEKFIETDEQVRRTLNRKAKVEDIRHKVIIIQINVDDAIARSMVEVHNRRSPDRFQRDSPNRR